MPLQNVDVESVGAMPNVMADPGGRVLHRCRQEEEVGGILSFSPRGAYFFFSPNQIFDATNLHG